MHGKKGDGYNMIRRGFDYGERNNGGVSMLDFAVAYDLAIVNSYFKKWKEHLVNLKSDNPKTRLISF